MANYGTDSVGRQRMTQRPVTSRYAAAAELLDPPGLHWKRDPVRWARERAEIELWSKQREIITAVRDHKQVSVRSCHEVGKSYIAAVTSTWWIDVHPPGEAFVLTTAPSDKQVKAILWREINRLHSRLGLQGRTNLSEWYIGKELVAMGRKPNDYDPTAFQGIHARYFLIVLDEACGIPKELWDAASTLGANMNSRTLAIGNPDDEHSEFATTVTSPDWHDIRVAYWDTPNFTDEPVSDSLKEMLIHPDWVAERERKWGRGSALFTSKCEGEFPRGTSPYTVVPITMAETCRQVELPAADPVEAGIDVGAGGDRTVIRERRGRRAGRQQIFIDSDPMRTVGNLARCIVEWGVTRVKIDPIGVGWGVMGRLKELSSKHNPTGPCTHHAEVIGWNVAEAPTPGKEDQFLNKRAEMWWNGRELSRLQQWDLSDVDDDVIQELTTPLYVTMDSKGKVKIQPKEDIIKVLGRSPDLAEALLLAFVDTTSEAYVSDQDMASVDLLRDVQPHDWASSSNVIGMSGHTSGGYSGYAGGGFADFDLLGR